MNDSKNNRKNRPNNRRKNNQGKRNNNPQSNSNTNNNNNRKKNQGGKNRRPKSLSPLRILQKYDNLLEQHIIARKKYFEIYGRSAGKQLEKVEANFEKTLRDLRNFETGLKDWQREVLVKKIDMYPQDNHYSEMNEIEPIAEKVNFSGEFEDPHLLATQKSENWQEDTEESSGSMEDYYAYKGIEPPVKS